MNFLSKILSYEYQNSGILIQTVTPNQVETKLSQDVINPVMIVRANDYVRETLQTLGIERQTNGHSKHKFINNTFLWFGWLIGDHLFMKFKLYAGKKFRSEYDEKVKYKLNEEQQEKEE